MSGGSCVCTMRPDDAAASSPVGGRGKEGTDKERGGLVIERKRRIFEGKVEVSGKVRAVRRREGPLG